LGERHSEGAKLTVYGDSHKLRVHTWLYHFECECRRQVSNIN